MTTPLARATFGTLYAPPMMSPSNSGHWVPSRGLLIVAAGVPGAWRVDDYRFGGDDSAIRLEGIRLWTCGEPFLKQLRHGLGHYPDSNETIKALLAGEAPEDPSAIGLGPNVLGGVASMHRDPLPLDGARLTLAADRVLTFWLSHNMMMPMHPPTVTVTCTMIEYRG